MTQEQKPSMTAQEEAKRRYPEEINVEKSTARNQRKNQRIFIEGADWQASKEGWIDVKSGVMPEKMQEVLFTHTEIKDWSGHAVKPSVTFGWYDRDSFHSFIDPRDNWKPTHWMPLPAPPQSNT